MKKKSLGSVQFTAATYRVLRRLVKLLGRRRVRRLVDDLKSQPRITPEMILGWLGVLPNDACRKAFLDWLRLEAPEAVAEAFP